jgi:hypothetical protein
MSLSFGLAAGSLVTAWFLGDLPQSDRLAVTRALHYAFMTLAALTMLSSLSFWTLRPGDGASVSGSRRRGVTDPPQSLMMEDTT